MEALLPSEVCRLVLGFIEEQNCTEAAKLFLETCTHLRECVAAIQSGRKFGTQVYGKTLINILDEYTLIHSIVQERIQELPENAASQLKSSCGNLPEQVKHLINGKLPGQRFHVNITVPTQVGVPQSNITSLGGLISNSSHQGHQRSKSRILGQSPSSSVSSRSRRTSHHMQEKRLTLRSQDSLEDVTASVTVQRIEATQLQSLPGSSGSPTSERGSQHLQRAHEENSSLLDPKTGELYSPCDVSRSVQTTSYVSKSDNKETGDPLGSHMLQNKEVPCNNESVKFCAEEQVVGRTSTGSMRTSLEKFVAEIFSSHVDEKQYHHKEVKTVMGHTSESITQHDSSLKLCEKSADMTLEHTVEAAQTPSSKKTVNFPPPFHDSPSDKEVHKSVHESCLYTPRRSGAKRKAKPTPLKMITPMKSKAVPEASDSADVMVDPKLFFGPLLDNRQLHEKIAENINQLMLSSGAEAGTEVAVVQAPEAPTCPPSASADPGMHQELEKVIKTVVDKTEADPLFERLLNEILGPEFEEDCSSMSMLGDKSCQGEGELLTGKTPDGKSGPPMSLEDQNEEAIKSILKVQPMEEEVPCSKSLVQGGSCKSQVNSHSVKIIRGRPSGACKSIFSAMTGDGQGKNYAGAVIPAANDENGQQANKLVFVPMTDVLGPPLSFPRVIIDGVAQYIVPLDSLDTIRMVKPIAPAVSCENITPVNQFVLRKATAEDLKNLNCKPLVLPISSSELTTAAGSSARPSLLQLSVPNSLPFATSTPSTSASFALPSLDFGDCQNKSVLSKTNEGQTLVQINESELETSTVSKGPNSGKESTPTVLNSRPDRAVTEGSLPILEPPKATPMMTLGNPRVSLSTPRRNRASGHVRALDFGKTPPSKQSPSDSQPAGPTPEIPMLEMMHRRQAVSSKIMRKDLQNVLEPSDKLPDPSTCIATRSPPPRLSGAWNKVGVDLIFGGGTSPNEMSTSTLCSRQNRESETNEMQVKINKTDITTDDVCRWESPNLRKKGTWDADLRAIVSATEHKPRLTKKQQRAKERRERVLKRTEEAAKKRATKEEVANIDGEGVEESSAEGKCSQNSMGKEEVEQENPVKDKDGKDEKSVEDTTSEDTKEEEYLPKKGKQRRMSLGERMQKKKAVPKKSLEKTVPTIEVNEPVLSPEKIRVVQQSPGSYANKRSIHEVSQNLLDSEPGKWPGIIGSARKRLDLQETPRKSDLSIGNNGRHCPAEDILMLSACDRSTLTVVETPLFPLTPNINLLNTPNGQDSRESVETFPSYFKPREKEAQTAEKESVQEEVVVSKSREEGKGSAEGNIPQGKGSGKEVVGDDKNDDPGDNLNENKVDDEVASQKESDVSKKQDVIAITTTRKRKQNCRPRKPVARKSIAGKQTKAKNSRLSANKEQMTTEESQEEQPQRRVLRPRRSKAAYQEDSLEKDDMEAAGTRKKKALEESDDDCPLSFFKRKGRKSRKSVTEISMCQTLSEEVTEKGLKFEPLASEEEKAQNQEAEILARAIKLKLSPLYPKARVLEEEESDEDSIGSNGPMIRKTPSKLVAKPLILSSSSSSSSSDSSSSSSYSSDSSSDEDTRPNEANAKTSEAPIRVPEALVTVPETRDTVPKAPVAVPETPVTVPEDPVTCEVTVKSLELSETPPDSAVDPAETTIKSHVAAIENISAYKSQGEIQGPPSEVVSEIDKPLENEMVQSTDLARKQKDRKSENELITEDVNCKAKVVAAKECNSKKEKEKGLSEKEKGLSEKEMEAVGDMQKQKREKTPEVPKCSKVTGIERKQRRDNLEMILFGNKNQESEEENEEMAWESANISTSITNPSFADLRFQSELERKRLRTLNIIKGGSLGWKSNASRRITLGQSQHLSSPTKPPATTEKPLSESQARVKPKKKTHSADEPRLDHSNDQEQMLRSEENEEDCPTLRLSEGDDTCSPSKRIVPSPSKFELLDTIEEKLAVMHGGISSPVMKKTARMSCSPGSSHLVKSASEKDKSSLAVQETSGFNEKTEETGVKSRGKTNSTLTTAEPVPSTSKAAERMHRAAEKKYARDNARALSPSKISGVTFRTRNSLKEKDTKKSAIASNTSSSLSSNQLDPSPIEEKKSSKQCVEKPESSKEKDKISSEFIMESVVHRISNLQDKTQPVVTSKKEFSNKKKSNHSKLPVDQISQKYPKENQKQTFNLSSKIDNAASSKFQKVPEERKLDESRPRSSGIEKPVVDVSKRKDENEMQAVDKSTSSTNPTEGEKEHKNKHSKSSKNVKNTNRNSYDEEGVKSSDNSKKSNCANGPSHSQMQSGKLRSGASKLNENGASNTSNGKTSEVNKDVTCSSRDAGTYSNANHLSPEATNIVTKGNGCRQQSREPVMDLAFESNKVQSEALNLKKDMSKLLSDSDSRRQPEEKCIGSCKTSSGNSAENTKKLEKGHLFNSSKSKIKSRDEDKETQSKKPSNSSLDKNLSQVAESKKSEISNTAKVSGSSAKPNISQGSSEKTKVNLIQREAVDEFPNKSQSNATCRITVENSESLNLDCISKQKEMITSPEIKTSERGRSANDKELYNIQSSDIYHENQFEHLSPESVNELSFELDEGIVRLTRSPYVELLVIAESVSESNVKKSCADLSGQTRTATPQVALRQKGSAAGEKKGSLSGSERKRKHSKMSGSDVGENATKASGGTSNRGCSKEQLLNLREKIADDSPIKRVLETLNAASNNVTNVDDDSLFTYTVLGCVDSEGVHAKDDEDSERFLPLKKRRTTTEESPVKLQPDTADGANNNSRMFFQLKGMEIEDFLSKVHGDGS